MVELELRLGDSSLACLLPPPLSPFSGRSETGRRLLTRVKSVPGITIINSRHDWVQTLLTKDGDTTII